MTSNQVWSAPGELNPAISSLGTIGGHPLSFYINQQVLTTSDVDFNSVTLVSTGASNSSELNYYEEGTFSCPFTGPVSLTVTAKFARIGKIVTLDFPTSTGISTSAAIFTCPANTIPSRLLPDNDVNTTIFVVDNSTNIAAAAYIKWGSDGTILIAKAFPNTNFTNMGTAGWFPSSFSWRVT